MTQKEKEAFVLMGINASLVYEGAFKQTKNNKDAERITFLFFSALIYGKDERIQMIIDKFC